MPLRAAIAAPVRPPEPVRPVRRAKQRFHRVSITRVSARVIFLCKRVPEPFGFDRIATGASGPQTLTGVQFPVRQGTNATVAAVRDLPWMDRPLRTSPFCRGRRCLTAIALLTAALSCSGCSFNLSSLTPGSDKDEPAAAASPQTRSLSAKTDPQEAKTETARGTTLAQSGQTAEALAAFNTAIDLDPYSAQAFYQRGLLYQSDKKYEFAIADFTSANGLTPQQADPLLGRAQCYLALGKTQEAAADLDEASQVAPGNVQVWMARGAAYEKLGNREKAADSFSRAVLLRPNDQPARNGLVRNGGRAG